MNLSRNYLFMLSLSTALAPAFGCGAVEDPAAPISGPTNPGTDTGTVMQEISAQNLLTPTALRDTILGGNATGIHGCDTDAGYEANHYENVGGGGGGTQLHVVGVYEPEEDGTVDVHITRPGSSVLFLSAYNPVRWNVTADNGSTIERIIASGYYAQEVTAPEGVAVEKYDYEAGGTYLGEAGYEWPSYHATDMVQVVEELTGTTLTSFRGCYRSASFQIDAPGALKPAHPVSNRTEPTPVPGCESITDESNYCIAAGYGGISMLGLDTGSVCGSVSPAIPLSYDASSLAWVGDYIYGCVRERGLARISVIDGSTDIAPVYCEMVTNLADGRLLALASLTPDEASFGHLMIFDTFEDAAQRNASHIFSIDPSASRIAVNGDRVYFAWHATTTIETALLQDGAQISSIALEGYHDWIFGLDVLDNGTLVIGGPARTGGIHLFDATGASLGTLASDFGNTDISGLECLSGGAN